MLAVTYGNTRIVRRLLIKGANRYIKNSEGKLPIDIAR
jgi:ankyrin repeat protein